MQDVVEGIKKKVVATSWHPGGANAISPVIKRLVDEGVVDVVTVGHQFSEKIFKDNGIDYKTVDFYNLQNVSIESMSRLLQEESPNLVFVGTSVQYDKNKDVIEQTITLAAREMGIKSLAVLDFWGDYSPRFSDIYKGEKFRFLPDRIAIMDQIALQAMIGEGFNRERLVITGNPYFDDLTILKESFNIENKDEVRSELGIDSDACVILFASQPVESDRGDELGYTEKTALKDLISALDKLKDRKKITLLVKVHLRENMYDLEVITRNCSIPVVVNQSYPIRGAVLASDIIVSPASTVLLESSYLDKPSISLQPGLVREDTLIINQTGMTVPVYQPGEIAFILEKLLFNDDYARELTSNRKKFRIDGRATERVVEVIYKMLDKI